MMLKTLMALSSLCTIALAFPLQPRQAATLPATGLQIFLDFDGTIATSDAFTTLAAAAYESLPSNSTVPPFSSFEDIYYQLYDIATANLSEPTDLASAIAYSNNGTLAAVESFSFDNVKRSGLFDTATEENLANYARNVTLRNGWCDFAQAAQERDIQIHVISLNWSPSWIRLVLQEASTCPNVTENIQTYCSEVLPAGILPANALNNDVPLFNGNDKYVLIQEILANVTDSANQTILFASDGDADLQPLVESPINLGIVAGYDGSAYETLSQFGLQVKNATAGWQGYTGMDSVYGFESYDELRTLLWGA